MNHEKEKRNQHTAQRTTQPDLGLSLFSVLRRACGCSHTWCLVERVGRSSLDFDAITYYDHRHRVASIRGSRFVVRLSDNAVHV